MIQEIGMLQISLQARGLNRDTLGVSYKTGKAEFTKKAIKAYNSEKRKKAILLVPITDLAFAANGKTEGMFNKWIKDMVHDYGGIDYKVDNYNSLRYQL